MSGKYGFDKGIDLPPISPEAKPRPATEAAAISQAVEAGHAQGFVSREPSLRLRPGPKRKEPQDKVTIPGPKRVVDDFRAFCRSRNITLWEGLEILLSQHTDTRG
jgi:hypothetical protein